MLRLASAPYSRQNFWSIQFCNLGCRAIQTSTSSYTKEKKVNLLRNKQQQGKKISTKDLPHDTLYILDGTSLLFQAYHSREHLDQFDKCILSNEFSAKLQKKMNIDMAAYNEEVLALTSSRESRGASAWGFASVDTNNDNIDSTSIDNETHSRVYCGALSIMSLKFARFIRDVRPRYFAVAFDTGSKTFRNEIYPEYKGTRKGAPLLITTLFGLAPQVLSELGAECFGLPGFEADDVMASLSTWGTARGMHVVHVSSDKDMLQLVADNVHVLRSSRDSKLTGLNDVETLLGVPAASIVDYMALVGDSADAVPGVKGVGPRIASALVKAYGSIEGILISLDLPDDAAPSAEQASNLASTVSVAARNALKNSIQELKVKASAEKVIAKLFQTGGDQLRLYYKLILLRSDLVPLDMRMKQRTEQQGIMELTELSEEFLRFQGALPNADKSLRLISESLDASLQIVREFQRVEL